MSAMTADSVRNLLRVRVLRGTGALLSVLVSSCSGTVWDSMAMLPNSASMRASISGSLLERGGAGDAHPSCSLAVVAIDAWVVPTTVAAADAWFMSALWVVSTTVAAADAWFVSTLEGSGSGEGAVTMSPSSVKIPPSSYCMRISSSVLARYARVFGPVGGVPRGRGDMPRAFTMRRHVGEVFDMISVSPAMHSWMGRWDTTDGQSCFSCPHPRQFQQLRSRRTNEVAVALYGGAPLILPKGRAANASS